MKKNFQQKEISLKDEICLILGVVKGGEREVLEIQDQEQRQPTQGMKSSQGIIEPTEDRQGNHVRVKQEEPVHNHGAKHQVNFLERASEDFLLLE
jgi:hypothetical protein